MTLFTFVVLISQFLENDMFSIKMDPCIQFRSSKGLEKAFTFEIFTKNNFWFGLVWFNPL